MGAAFCAAFGLAAVMLALVGIGPRGIHAGLLATARLAFLLFWPAYAGPALAALFGPVFQPLRQHARALGLAFAAALLVHLGLVAWLCLIGAAPARATFVVFGIAAAATYLLALLSIDGLWRALGARAWGILRSVAMNYVAWAFAVDFLNNPLHGGLRHVVGYLPFAVLAVVGPVLRLAAWLRSFGRLRRDPAPRSG
jgi:hypothetical protein